MVAVTVAQRSEGGRARVLAHGYPLRSQALGTMLSDLADRYAIAAELHALGRIVLTTAGQLSAPEETLH